MNTLARIHLRPSLAILISSLLLVLSQAAELSSADLKKAQNSLQGFEFSGTGVKPPEPFEYTEGHFPHTKLTTELRGLEKFFVENNITRLPIHLTHAFGRDDLSDAELVVAVRSGRVIFERVRKHLQTISEQGGTSNGE